MLKANRMLKRSTAISKVIDQKLKKMRRDIDSVKSVQNVIPLIISSDDQEGEEREKNRRAVKLVKPKMNSRNKNFLSTKLKKLLKEFKESRGQHKNLFKTYLSNEDVTFFPGAPTSIESEEIPELVSPALNEGVRKG